MSTQLAIHLCSAETRAGPLCLPGRLGGNTAVTPSELIKRQAENTQVSLTINIFPIHDSLKIQLKKHNENLFPYICEHAELNLC